LGSASQRFTLPYAPNSCLMAYPAASCKSSIRRATPQQPTLSARPKTWSLRGGDTARNLGDHTTQTRQLLQVSCCATNGSSLPKKDLYSIERVIKDVRSGEAN